MKCWTDSRSLKHLWKIRPEEELECFDQTMVEYTSGGFVYFCEGAGIKREFTVPDNSQQNGVAERKNWMIVSATRAMLHDQ